MNALKRELWFLLRDQAAVFWLALLLICVSYSLLVGVSEVNEQRATIERLKIADAVERNIVNKHHNDWGSAAYYTFHLTYDEPSQFAFAALGQRDQQPWKHRIRMLALEGQIYEADLQNPEFALLGRFDYAFVVAVLLPLFIIFTLYDLRAKERVNGRFELLDATNNGLWRARSIIRTGLLTIVCLVPFWLCCLIQNASFSTAAIASLVVLFHSLFWWGLITILVKKDFSGTFNLTMLVGIWLVFSIALPATFKVIIDGSISIPDDGELLLTQREAVNDAWDLPVERTMQPFVERHPQWAEYTEMDSSFEWKWYYAFQQVGDQVVEPISIEYRKGREKRDDLAAMLSWFSPPAKVERLFQLLANTNMSAQLEYEDRIRQFHQELRTYYYPKLFRDEPFCDEALATRPNYPINQNENGHAK